MMRRAVTQILSKRTNYWMTPVRQQASATRWMSSNITYSGGQASEGQGGFYGSGGARATKSGDGTPPRTEHRPELLALAGDVQKIVEIMNEVDALENLLLDTTNNDDTHDTVSPQTIEIRTNIKKLMTSKDFRESLDRLEIEGQPVWGLSSDERDLITQARMKMNDC